MLDFGRFLFVTHLLSFILVGKDALQEVFELSLHLSFFILKLILVIPLCLYLVKPVLEEIFKFFLTLVYFSIKLPFELDFINVSLIVKIIDFLLQIVDLHLKVLLLKDW